MSAVQSKLHSCIAYRPQSHGYNHLSAFILLCTAILSTHLKTSLSINKQFDQYSHVYVSIFLKHDDRL